VSHVLAGVIVPIVNLILWLCTCHMNAGVGT
jgi:hypothetical protein